MNTSLISVVDSLLALVVWRKEATLVRNYWKAKSWLLVLALLFLILSPVGAQESLSSYFVKITDASKAVKNGNQSEAQKLVTEMATDFEGVENKDSEAGKVVKEKLAQSGEITDDKLTELFCSPISL